MRHRKAGLKLNRTPSHRNAMFRNMVTSLLKHERIRTTGAKAKELRRWADHVITLAKRGDLHARRQALAIVREKDVVHKLFAQAAERFGAISGGYTRIIKLGRRPGDAAPVALVELVAVAPAKKKKQSVKPKDAEGKVDKASEKKTKAKSKDDAVKPAAKPASKKKAAGDEKEKKPVTKTAAEKKTTKAKPAETGKEDKPKKKDKGATKKEDTADSKKKKAAAKKAPEDKK